MTTVYNVFLLCFVACRTIFDTFFREVFVLAAWLVTQEFKSHFARFVIG